MLTVRYSSRKLRAYSFLCRHGGLITSESRPRVSHDKSWQILTSLNKSWQVLTILDQSQQFFESLNKSRQFLTNLARYWQVSTSLDKSWWVSTNLDKSRKSHHVKKVLRCQESLDRSWNVLSQYYWHLCWRVSEVLAGLDRLH